MSNTFLMASYYSRFRRNMKIQKRLPHSMARSHQWHFSRTQKSISTWFVAYFSFTVLSQLCRCWSCWCCSTRTFRPERKKKLMTNCASGRWNTADGGFIESRMSLLLRENCREKLLILSKPTVNLLKAYFRNVSSPKGRACVYKWVCLCIRDTDPSHSSHAKREF